MTLVVTWYHVPRTPVRFARGAAATGAPHTRVSFRSSVIGTGTSERDGGHSQHDLRGSIFMQKYVYTAHTVLASSSVSHAHIACPHTPHTRPSYATDVISTGPRAEPS